MVCTGWNTNALGVNIDFSSSFRSVSLTFYLRGPPSKNIVHFEKSMKKSKKSTRLGTNVLQAILINILKEGRVRVISKAYFGGILCKLNQTHDFSTYDSKKKQERKSSNLAQIHLRELLMETDVLNIINWPIFCFWDVF